MCLQTNVLLPLEYHLEKFRNLIYIIAENGGIPMQYWNTCMNTYFKASAIWIRKNWLLQLLGRNVPIQRYFKIIIIYYKIICEKLLQHYFEISLAAIPPITPNCYRYIWYPKKHYTMILNITAGIPFLGKKYNNPSPEELQANLKTSDWGIPLTYRLITVHKIKWH